MLREPFLIGTDLPKQANPPVSGAGKRQLVPVQLAAGERVDVLIRIDSESRPFLHVYSWEPVAFTAREAGRYQTHAAMLAVILTLALVLALTLDLRYLLVSLWMLAMFVFQAELEDYISFMLFDSLSSYSMQLRFSSAVLALASFMSLSVFMLGLHRHRRWRWVAPVCASLALAYTGLTFVLDGVLLRNLLIGLSLVALAVWPLMLPAAWRKSRDWQLLMICVLGVAWGSILVYCLSYAFNIRFSSRFTEVRAVLNAAVVLGLVLVYTLQKRDYKRSLEAQLRQKEQLERSMLEALVEERTRELQIVNQRLEQLVRTDPLTGAANRRHFVEQLQIEVQRARRGNAPLALLMMDMDHFKRINDTFGHAAGDEVLRNFSRVVGATLRVTDMFARLGGEEFALLLPNTGQDGTIEVAQRVLEAVRQQSIDCGNGQIRYTVSIGAALLAGQGSSYDSLLKRADEALYRAKKNGRNQVQSDW